MYSGICAECLEFGMRSCALGEAMCDLPLSSYARISRISVTASPNAPAPTERLETRMNVLAQWPFLTASSSLTCM